MPGRLVPQSGRKAGNGSPDRVERVVIGKEVPSQPVPPTFQNFEASSSSNGAWPRRIFRLASSRENHSARSTSGKSWKRPDPRGHSIEKVLLRIAAASASPSKAQASTILPPRLPDRRELNEGSARLDAGLLHELARSRGERFLAGVGLPLGNRPGAQVLVLPERTARMDEQHVQAVFAAAEHEQARAALRHVAILTANLLPAATAGTL